MNYFGVKKILHLISLNLLAIITLKKCEIIKKKTILNIYVVEFKFCSNISTLFQALFFFHPILSPAFYHKNIN